MSAPKVFLGLVLFWTLVCVMAPVLIPGSAGRADGQCAAIYTIGSNDAAHVALDQACTPSGEAVHPSGFIDSIMPWPWALIWVIGVGFSGLMVIRYREALRPG